jgi:hypothetical protein
MTYEQAMYNEQMRQARAQERQAAAYQREINRQENAYAKAVQKQQNAYVRDINRQEKAYQREMTKQEKAYGKEMAKAEKYYSTKVNTDELVRLGFNNTEINELLKVYNNMGKFTPSALQSYGYTYEQAKRLAYMYNVCTGKVTIDSKQDAIKHLKRTFGANYKISMQDLPVSSITNVPRVAVVGNIKESPYDIWNSSNYKGTEGIYKVIDVSSTRITVETSIKPRLEYGKPKEIPGVLEIKGVKNNGTAVVAFDKNYCRLCNRFIIVASLRNPEFHCGKYEIICCEGSKVYVYATNMGTKENTHYNGNTQRVYQYGLFSKDIKGKLSSVAKALYKHFEGVSAEYNEATQEFITVPRVQKQEEEDTDTVIM